MASTSREGAGSSVNPLRLMYEHPAVFMSMLKDERGESLAVEPFHEKCLQDLKHAWEWADEAERASLVRAIYRRIVVEGDRFVGVELTEEAKANSLALALPQSVALARPARLELTTFWSATRCSIH